MIAGTKRPVETIAIRNPRIREVVAEEVAHGTGRNSTEAAENMILADAERRRIDRATSARRPRRVAAKSA